MLDSSICWLWSYGFGYQSFFFGFCNLSQLGCLWLEQSIRRESVVFNIQVQNMTSFSPSTLEKKLNDLSNTQQSVQTLSLWLIHHRKHAKAVVQTWNKEVHRGKYTSNVDFPSLNFIMDEFFCFKYIYFIRLFSKMIVLLRFYKCKQYFSAFRKDIWRLIHPKHTNSVKFVKLFISLYAETFFLQ